MRDGGSEREIESKRERWWIEDRRKGGTEGEKERERWWMEDRRKREVVSAVGP